MEFQGRQRQRGPGGGRDGGVGPGLVPDSGAKPGQLRVDFEGQGRLHRHNPLFNKDGGTLRQEGQAWREIGEAAGLGEGEAGGQRRRRVGRGGGGAPGRLLSRGDSSGTDRKQGLPCI